MMKKMFPVQVISDLHLDINLIDFSKIIVPKTSNLFLAGDISPTNFDIYSKFLRFCSREFDSVYMVSGNHEYYLNDADLKQCEKNLGWRIELEQKMKPSITTIDNKIKAICSEFPCIEFLQKNKISLPGINLMGCTLWTKLPQNFQYTNNIQDFRKIYQFDTIKRNIIHNDHKEWLKSNLSKTKRNIILTHHAPLFTGVFQRQYENSYYSCLFASNMNDLYLDVDTWLYGHTHKNTDIKLGGIYPRFISNPYGLPSDQNSYSDKIFYL